MVGWMYEWMDGGASVQTGYSLPLFRFDSVADIFTTVSFPVVEYRWRSFRFQLDCSLRSELTNPRISHIVYNNERFRHRESRNMADALFGQISELCFPRRIESITEDGRIDNQV